MFLADLNADEKDISIFLEEALAMKGFHHPNILPLHGVVFKEYLPLVVFEYMDKGDLKSYIVKNKLTQVSLHTGSHLTSVFKGRRFFPRNRPHRGNLSTQNWDELVSSMTMPRIVSGLSGWRPVGVWAPGGRRNVLLVQTRLCSSRPCRQKLPVSSSLKKDDCT